MLRIHIALLLGLFGLSREASLGFSSDGSSLTRSIDSSVVLTNSLLIVSVSFTNVSTTPLRGFFYTDEVPSGLLVRAVSVSIDGIKVTNYTTEVGQTGDVYPGYVPYRWIIESPTNFSESNAILPKSSLNIDYSLSSSTGGIFILPQFNWAGFRPSSTNSAFGHAENSDQLTVRIVQDVGATVTSAQQSAGGFKFLIDGVVGLNYAVEVSTDLSNWVAVGGGTAPLSFADTNSAAFDHRFYRARWLR